MSLRAPTYILRNTTPPCSVAASTTVHIPCGIRTQCTPYTWSRLGNRMLRAAPTPCAYICSHGCTTITHHISPEPYITEYGVQSATLQYSIVPPTRADPQYQGQGNVVFYSFITTLGCRVRSTRSILLSSSSKRYEKPKRA